MHATDSTNIHFTPIEQKYSDEPSSAPKRFLRARKHKV